MYPPNRELAGRGRCRRRNPKAPGNGRKAREGKASPRSSTAMDGSRRRKRDAKCHGLTTASQYRAAKSTGFFAPPTPPLTRFRSGQDRSRVVATRRKIRAVVRSRRRLWETMGVAPVSYTHLTLPTKR